MVQLPRPYLLGVFSQKYLMMVSALTDAVMDHLMLATIQNVRFISLLEILWELLDLPQLYMLLVLPVKVRVKTCVFVAEVVWLLLEVVLKVRKQFSIDLASKRSSFLAVPKVVRDDRVENFEIDISASMVQDHVEPINFNLQILFNRILGLHQILQLT